MSTFSLSQPCPRSIEVGGICYTLNLSFDRVLSAFELLSSDELEGIDSFDVIFDWFVIAPKVKAVTADNQDRGYASSTSNGSNRGFTADT